MVSLRGEEVTYCSPKAQRYIKVGANLVESVPPAARKVLSDAIAKQKRLKLRTTLSGELVDLVIFGTLVLLSNAAELEEFGGQVAVAKAEVAAGAAAAAAAVAATTAVAATANSATASNLSALQTAFSYENDATGKVVEASSALKKACFVSDDDELFKVHEEDTPRFLVFETAKLELLESGKGRERRSHTLTLRISRPGGGWQWSRLTALRKGRESSTVLTTVAWTVGPQSCARGGA